MSNWAVVDRPHGAGKGLNHTGQRLGRGARAALGCGSLIALSLALSEPGLAGGSGGYGADPIISGNGGTGSVGTETNAGGAPGGGQGHGISGGNPGDNGDGDVTWSAGGGGGGGNAVSAPHASGSGGAGFDWGGNGGAGGTLGEYITSGSEVLSSPVQGGNGGNGTASGHGGGGGGGGDGVIFEGAGILTVGAQVQGGHGGDGGSSTGGGGGGGGGGGAGVIVSGNGQLVVDAEIAGGSGGAGGDGSIWPGPGGGGGGGGAGVAASDTTITIGAGGRITGGAGGASSNFAGSGGAGIVGQNLTVNLNTGGMIAGGQAMAGAGAHAFAIDFTGGANVINFSGSSSQMAGAINIRSGSVQLGAASGGTTVANAISGAGGLIYDTLGETLTLSGANTYSGTTEVRRGTLRANATATFSPNSTLVISPSGTVELNGLDQTVAALDTNTAQGSGNISLGHGSLTVSGNGMSSGAHFIFEGSISGTGGIIKDGAHHQQLSGTSFYSGATYINDGTLSAGLNAFSSQSAHVVAAGATLWNSASNRIGSLAGQGDVRLGAGTFTAGGDNSSTVFSGTMFGNGGFSKEGAGTLTLSGTGIYTGATTVSEGRLEIAAGASIISAATVNGGAFMVDGRAAGVTVNNGALFGGSGTSDAIAVATGGILAPGNSIGSNTAASLTMHTGAIFEVEVNDGGFTAGVNNDHTRITGAATFADGAIIAVRSYPAGDDGSTYAAGRYTILDAQDLDVQGDLIIDENFAFLDFTTGYSTTSLWLDSYLVASTFCLAGSSKNQCAAGDAIFALGPTGSLYQQLTGMTAGEALASQDLLSGEVHASIKGAILEDSRFVRDAVTDRLRAAFGGVGSAGMPLLAYGEDGPQPVPADAGRFGAWSSAFGAWGSFDGDGNAAAMKRSTGGFLVGADGPALETWRLGVMAGYSHSSFTVADRSSSASSDNYHLGLYAGTQWGNLGFRSGLAYNWHDIKTSRLVALPGFTDSLSDDYRAGTFQAFGELGYRIDTATASFEPFASLAHVRLRTAGFSETGGAAGLHGASQRDETSFTMLGLRASTKLEFGGMKATAHGAVGWRHAFDAVPSASHGFSGGDVFTVAGTPIARDAAVLEAGLDLDMTQATTLGLSYRGQLASGARNHGFNAAFRASF